MKKILTVSLFAMMAVSAANADIASTKYVDDIAKTKQASLGFTPENVANKVTDIPADTNDLTDAQYPSAKAMVSYVGDELATMQTSVADLIDPLASRVTTAEGNITSLQSDKANKSDVYTKTEADTEFMDSSEVSTAISNVVKDYSTTTQMNNAIKTANDTQTNTITSAYQSADTTTLSSAKSYADAEDKKIEDTIGTVTEGKTVVQMINEASTNAGTNLTNALKNYSTTTQMNNAIKTANDTQTSTITTAYQSADTATLNSAKAFTTEQIEALGKLATIDTACAQGVTDCALVIRSGEIKWEKVSY